VVKKQTAKSHEASTHQTVTGEFNFKAGSKTIHITTTEQKLSGHAGQVSFWSFLHLRKVRALLAKALPHRPTSPNAMRPVDIACGFLAGVLAGADRLTRIAWLRGDPLLPEVMASERIPSQSTISRFLSRFTAGSSLQCFRQLWRWTMEKVPARRAGYTLDLDTTSLLHEDGQQEGVRVGHTRVGLKPCLQPMLAVLAEAKMCVQFWLRPGNAHCSNNLIAFTLELLSQLPRHLRLRLVRADSGFYDDRWLSLLESQGLPYIVVTDLSCRVKSLIKKTTRWLPTPVEGLEVAEELYESQYASRPRRLILVRRQEKSQARGGGKLLLDCPGYKFQVLVTSLPASFSPLQVWFEYNGRANIENVIKELKHGYGIAGFCCQKFFATEAALALTVFTYNLTALFARHLGWLEKMTIQTLRFRLFRSAGIISHGQRRTTVRLGIAKEHRTWWAEVWEKILCPFSNCNAVGQKP
jgi:hypothetical protein